MKDYEHRAQQYLPRRSYTLIRVDGKAFHTYTRGLKKPFDEGLVDDMEATMIALCTGIQGAKLAYHQSDEITVVVTDFDTHETCMWFNGRTDKMCSVAASIATAEFNSQRLVRAVGSGDIDVLQLTGGQSIRLAQFDARVFTVPTRAETLNNLLWRQRDAIKNSISAAAQHHFSEKQLRGVNGNEKKRMLLAGGYDWNTLPIRLQRGSVCIKRSVFTSFTPTSVDLMPDGQRSTAGIGTSRSKWMVEPAPDFAAMWDSSMIPERE